MFLFSRYFSLHALFCAFISSLGSGSGNTGRKKGDPLRNRPRLSGITDYLLEAG